MSHMGGACEQRVVFFCDGKSPPHPFSSGLGSQGRRDLFTSQHEPSSDAEPAVHSAASGVLSMGPEAEAGQVA